ncbi:MAG TPA: thioredoxin-like domain-containing protein [Candidatus Baltobacteraceae bacterium]|jgi:thiol-disulfide isomerase/thioredoxin|nr:thioredoxin-like domain-containing protein [Candidatus Baltobacteraceae bacterium]
MKRWTTALLGAIFLLAPAPASPALQPLLHAANWLNGRLSPGDFDGRVVVLDVFTVDCVNCRNVVPELRDLYRRDRGRGLAIVGIHAPETPAEKQRPYVAENLRRQGIVWPVAVDNAFALWNAYGVDAWPTQLIFDRHGRLRKTIVGDSQDDLVRSSVETLLSEQ